MPFSPLSHLLGTAIADIEGAVVGHVTEFLVDEADGRVAYVQLRLHRDPDAPDRRVTVPWSAINSAGRDGTDWQLRVAATALDALGRQFQP